MFLVYHKQRKHNRLLRRRYLYRDFMAQGYITPDGLKTFLEMGKLYEKAGGNDIYHEKLLPDIESLEVRYTKDSVL